MKNYFDKNGNYINIENLSLAEIYLRASEEGYKKGYVDGSCGMKIIRPVPNEIRDIVEGDRLLDDRDGTIAGRAHE